MAIKDTEQDLWAWNCCLQPQHPILNAQCAKQVDAAPWGLGSHPHPLSFHPHFSPPTLNECSGSSVVCYLSLSLFLSLTLSQYFPLVPSPYFSCLICGGRGRVSCSQRQTAHPSITSARSLWRWALSSTTQLLPSIKMYRWARMHTHRRLSQTLLSGWMNLCQFTHICNARRKAHIRLHTWANRCTFTPQSDSKKKIGGPLSFALTNRDEDKLLGLFTWGKAGLCVLSLPLFTQQFCACLFHPLLCTHRRLMRTQLRLVYLSTAVRHKTAQSLTVKQFTKYLKDSHKNKSTYSYKGQTQGSNSTMLC